MTILINKLIDTTKLNHDFLENGIVRVFDFLTPKSALELSDCLSLSTSFDNAFYIEGKNRQASDLEIANLPTSTKQELYQNIYDSASKGSGFLYGRHKIESNSLEILKETLNLLNTQQVLDFVKKITNVIGLTHADGQATKFRKGDFLTRHVDDIPGETRKIAYVLSMTENWHPDWGGLLQFFQQNGAPTNSWSPVYNSLTMFDVKKIHSVTSIANFAAQNRYSITGWFRL